MAITIEIYNRIIQVLEENLIFTFKYSNGNQFLALGDTGVWLSASDDDLTVGYGMPHNHYYPNVDDLSDGVKYFFDLLTKRKRITEFYKGQYIYKTVMDIDLGNDLFKRIGTATTFIYPYWKKTIKKFRFESAIITDEHIANVFFDEQIQLTIQFAKDLQRAN